MNATTDKYIIELIEKLISKTDINEVKWEATSRNNQFLLKINSGAFIIEKNTYPASRDKPLISFKILDEIGDEIERIEQTLPLLYDLKKDSQTTKELDNLINKLYVKAEANVHKPINDSLKKILNELDIFSNSKK
ncbi:hypothetical protein [Arcicella rigui]|uniref:Uncharacterized protein n=1 Tax=Arcicella rigui TaxID=797020 RepID=A0ABU5QAD7_9BACT|nr:hypothetical protein [Arcicella rigui]MEA5139796.1 hypothetical protein [Arcicella rigui]